DPRGRSARALMHAHRYLPRRHSLVFIVSDFHVPLAELEQTLAGLAAHAVVPVVLWQPAEFAFQASRGLARSSEPESGTRQWLWWRPALRERWQQAMRMRRAALFELFRSRGLAPLFIEGAFDADAVTRHFLA
ncbi:MAG: MxaS protein, partial [Burkholderiaceae bacterium]